MRALVYISLLIVTVHTAFAQSVRSIEVALLRFRAKGQNTMIDDPKRLIFKTLKQQDITALGMNALTGALDDHGGVQIFYQEEAPVVPVIGKALFATNQEAQVFLVGRTGAIPNVTRFDVNLEATVAAADNRRVALTIKGNLKYSPQAMDRWLGNPGQFLAPFIKETTAAAQPLVGANFSSIEEYKTAGVGLVKLFKADTYAPEEGSIFEMPVLKHTAFDCARVVSRGDFLCQSTVTELGGQPAQAMVLLVLPKF